MTWRKGQIVKSDWTIFLICPQDRDFLLRPQNVRAIRGFRPSPSSVAKAMDDKKLQRTSRGTGKSLARSCLLIAYLGKNWRNAKQ